MSTDREMVDRGTGASRPCSPTREVACSPIISILQLKMDSSRPIIQIPSSSSNTSNNSTPVLASSSSMNPIPLMSIGFNNGYGCHSTNGPSTFKKSINKKWHKTREWPVDPPARYHFKYYQRRERLNRRHQLHHGHPNHDYQCHCRSCVSGPPTTASGNDMNLRQQNFPPKYWFHLHNHTLYPLPSLPPKTPRPPSKIKINKYLVSLAPHVQKFIYKGAIDKKSLQHLGVTNKYQQVDLVEQELQLMLNFEFKGYYRGVKNIQVKLQQQKPVIFGKSPILLLFTRFQQKAPILRQ
ncbi:unnamed protein product [Rotaria magnacalcarata]|uniref:Uncharacterized protein n=2 Tax=Rotaria magnacalcarata TaxID=392030 RepID=A0A815GKC4_9BILA|nr:unnamed protein product [Rotaria magnacalcarata]CAF1497679.1 unnamed protein product [Rotaria magnacalcarata]CAF4258648.1 unnamed protein product [Rotaria magnacalcarata]CAF4313820.1 unnamed protein product [Rotaria magnacalcarata]CAF4783544.1 unnamed protein product [Rotaria magnacalcarata]